MCEDLMDENMKAIWDSLDRDDMRIKKLEALVAKLLMKEVEKTITIEVR